LRTIASAVALYQKNNALWVDGIPWANTLSHMWIQKNTMNRPQIDTSNRQISQAESMSWFEKLPNRWKVILGEMVQRASTQQERNEILSGRYPVALTDTRTGTWIIIMWSQTIEFPVSYSRNGKFVRGFSEWDNAVNYGSIEHFTQWLPYQRGGMKIQVREQEPWHGTWSLKWWHAAAWSWANWLRNTIWCKWLPPAVAATLANYVNKNNKWFWYASRT
jgi:hypothetical protein